MATKGSTDVMATSLAHRVGSLERVGRRNRFLDACVGFLERRGLSERSEFRSPGRNSTHASLAQA